MEVERDMARGNEEENERFHLEKETGIEETKRRTQDENRRQKQTMKSN